MHSLALFISVSLVLAACKSTASDGGLARRMEIASAVLASVVDDTMASAARIVYVSSTTVDPERIISALGATKHIKLMPGAGEECQMSERRRIDSRSGLSCALMRLDVVSVQEKSASVRYQWNGPKGGVTIMTFSLEERSGRWIIVGRRVNLAS